MVLTLSNPLQTDFLKLICEFQVAARQFKRVINHEGSKTCFTRGSEFSSYEIELRKMMSHFELQTRNFLQKFFFQVTNSTS